MVTFGYKNFKLFRARTLYVFNNKISGSNRTKNSKNKKN